MEVRSVTFRPQHAFTAMSYVRNAFIQKYAECRQQQQHQQIGQFRGTEYSYNYETTQLVFFWLPQELKTDKLK